MIRKEKNNIFWLEYEIFQPFPHVRHGVFLRHGGISNKPHDSLNFSFLVGDTADNVKTNTKKALETLNIHHQEIRGNLTHSKAVLHVDSTNTPIPNNCDALTTNQTELPLLSTHADCQAALFYDPINNAIANVHCGWKGNVQNIYLETIKYMTKHYNTNPKDLLIGISPSLGPQKAEFRNFTSEFPKELEKYQVSPLHFDLWTLAKDQLTNEGIPQKNIEIAQICTLSNTNDFFSYRQEKNCGRNASIICLKGK
jgi:YfiH family protein